MIKKTDELIKKLKPIWQEQEKLTDEYHTKLYELEKKMEKETGIEGIEFFWGAYEGICGIGTANRKLELISDVELEKE